MSLNSVIDEAKNALFKSECAVTTAENAVISAKYALASSETALASAKTANFQIQKILAAAALAQDLENMTLDHTGIFPLGDCIGAEAISPNQTKSLDTYYSCLSEPFHPSATPSPHEQYEPTLNHSANRGSSAIFHQEKKEETVDQVDVKTYPDGFGLSTLAYEADENGNIEDADDQLLFSFQNRDVDVDNSIQSVQPTSYAEICRKIPLPASPCTPVIGRPPNFSVLSTSTPLPHCYTCGRTDCPSGRKLTKVLKSNYGQKIKPCGSTWPYEKLGLVGTIIGGCKENVLIRWDSIEKKPESYSLQARREYKFEMVCKELKSCKKQLILPPVQDFDEENMLGFSAVRLFVPNGSPDSHVWKHDIGGEKHRLLMCSSEDINLLGLGLYIGKSIEKIVFSICLTNYKQHEQLIHSIFSQTFHNVPKKKTTTVLKLNQKIPLSCDKIYLIVLNVFGGASIAGVGGEEFVSATNCDMDVLFKFDEYVHRDNGKNVTNVEAGLISKFYFDLEH